MSITTEDIKEVLDIIARDTVAAESWYRTQREAWLEYFMPIEWLTKAILLDAAQAACRDARGFAPKILQVRDQVNARRPKMARYVCRGELQDGQYVTYDCDNGILTIGTRRLVKACVVGERIIPEHIVTDHWAVRCPCHYASEALPEYSVATARLSRLKGFVEFFDPRTPPAPKTLSEGAMAWMRMANVV